MAFDPVPSDAHAHAALALHRFGFGPKPGDIARIAADPLDALFAELKSGPKTIEDPTLSSSAEDARETVAFQQEKKRERDARRMQAASASDMAGAESNEMSVRKPGSALPQSRARLCRSTSISMRRRRITRQPLTPVSA